MPNEDILWKASIEDKDAELTLRKIEMRMDAIEAHRAFDVVEKKVDAVNEAVGETANSTTQGIPAMALALGALGGVATSVFNQILGSLKQVIAGMRQYVKEAINLSRHVEMQREILYTLANAQGFTKKEIDKLIEGMRDTGITTRASTRVLNLMVEQQLDLAKATDIARVAQNRGRIAGLNSSETTERILFGITNLNTRMLKSIGIHISMQKATDDYARSMGKSSGAALTFTEKQQALTEAIIEYGSRATGAYEAAGETIGGALLSYPRAIEEIQLAIGKAFQPFADVFTQEKIDLVKALGTWFEDNKDKVAAFGDVMEMTANRLLDAVGAVGELVGVLPSLLEGLTLLEAQIFGIEGEQETIVANAKQHLGELVALVAGAMMQVVTFITGAFRVVASSVSNTMAFIKKEMTAEEFAAAQRQLWVDWEDAVESAGVETAAAVGQLLGVMEPLTDAVEDQDEVVEQLGQTWDEFAETVRAVDEALLKIRVRMARRLIEEQIRAQRRVIDLEIAASRRREDIARNTARALENIERGLQDARERATKSADKAQQRVEERAHEERLKLIKSKKDAELDLEKQYQRRLQAIRDEFMRTAREAAIKNDAITFLQAKRRMGDQLADAKRDRAEQAGDIKEDYEERRMELRKSLDEQRQAIRESLREQLESIDEQGRKQTESLQRSLARQDEDYQIHLKRQEEDYQKSLGRQREDQQRALQQQLDDLEMQHGEMMNVTAEGLMDQVREWGKVYGSGGVVDMLMEEFFKRQQGLMRRLEFGRYTGGEEAYGARGIGPGSDRGGRRFGQAGLVSSLLSDPVSQVNIPRVPAVPSTPAGGGVRSETVNFNFRGVEPYLQRVAVQAATEVLRNYLQ